MRARLHISKKMRNFAAVFVIYERVFGKRRSHPQDAQNGL